jgi:uncharacterized protein (TIGR04222 family)
LHVAAPLDAPQHAIESVIYDAVAARPAGATVRDVTRTARANGGGGFEPLVLAGLAHEPARARAARVLPALVVLAVATPLLLGALIVGARLPTAQGVMMCVVLLGAWWVVALTVLPMKCGRTYRGDEAVARFAADAEATGARATDAPTAMALGGVAAACALPLGLSMCGFFTLPPVGPPAPSSADSGGCAGCGGGCGGCGGCGG